MRISDWSSDVCSSDLIAIGDADPRLVMRGVIEADVVADGGVRPWIACGGLRLCRPRHQREDRAQIGRASCRERVCQYVSISVVAVSLKKKTKHKNDRQISND